MKIDFNNFPEIETKLSKNEIQNLNQIFSNPEVQKILSEIEENRLKRQKFFKKILFYSNLSFFIIFCFTVFLIFKNSGISLQNFIIEYIFLIFSFLFVGFFSIYFLCYYFSQNKFSSKIEWIFKKNIIPHLCDAVYSGMKYSTNDEFFLKDEDLIFLQKQKFWSSDNGVIKKEDSFYFELSKDWRKILFNGGEIETKKITKTKTKNWTKTKTEYKKYFLWKIFFQNSRLKLTSPVFVKSNLTDKIATFDIDNIVSSVVDNFFQNRIKLENTEFEKFFNVYSNDQIESRMLITPAFMDRLLEFSKKTNNKYEFFFFEDYFYLKRYIFNNFLEPKITKNIFESLGIYVDFYVEIREIMMLAHDMNLLYYSKISTNFEK